MKKLTHYLLIILIPINIIAYYYLYTHRTEISNFKVDRVVCDTVVKTQNKYISTDSILFITYENVEIKNEPNPDSPSKAYLKIHSVFYITQRTEKLDLVQIKRKMVEDYWYQINDYNGMSGWIYGYYTSKSLNKK